MGGFAAFVFGISMMAAAQDAAYAPYRAAQAYYGSVPVAQADAGYPPAYVYAPGPSPLPAMGAVSGGLIGAAGAGAPGLVLGAAVGGLMGDAMSRPQVVRVAPVYAPVYAAASPASSARGAESTDQYIRRWQGFIEPLPQR